MFAGPVDADIKRLINAPVNIRSKRKLRHTARFLILSFRILRAIHSPDVDPVSNSSRGALATALAIRLLFSLRARSTTWFPGRVKNVIEYRGSHDCSPGGGLWRDKREKNT